MLNRLKRALFRAADLPPAAGAVPAELAARLPERRASAIHELLRDGSAFAATAVQQAARDAGWSALELEKLTAYLEFYSGQSAQAYQRILTQDLAQADGTLLLTACMYCYRYNRHAEGYALFKRFAGSLLETDDPGRLLAYAGYLAFVGGGTADEALAYFDRALDRDLISPLLVVNAYPIYFESGRHDRAAQLRQLIQERYAGDYEAIYAVAYVELARDYYPEGFRLAEARYAMPEAARSINASLLSKPRWGGAALHGQRLLVHGEQGLGDVIMMARYLPQLIAQDARIILDCREVAIPLLAHNFPACTLIASDLHTPIAAEFDVWTGIMSLPFHFATTTDTVPATAGYLTVPTEQRDYWRQRTRALAPAGTWRIGIAWSGNPEHRADRRRSIPAAQIRNYLPNDPRLQFFALQIGTASDRCDFMHDLSEELVTLADTAALIAEMDLIITVDTSIVHLAGALGKPAWLLLPFRYEWRWSLGGERNRWYDSVRVLRQRHQGDWDHLLAEVFGERLSLFMRDCPS